MKRMALFSLDDTTKADQFARRLIQDGWDILASRETVALLKDKGLPVQDIADFTQVHEDYGFPPTLHARVEHALTADAQPRIDLAYVIPYPLSRGNDVGGRTLLALAVKGGRAAVMNIEDMEKAVSQIVDDGEISGELRLELADKACFEISRHYAGLVQNKGKHDILSGHAVMALKNGENPYQMPAAAFAIDQQDDPLALSGFKQIVGENPCFTNMADADCIVQTLCLADEACRVNGLLRPHICIAAKHGNPCGAALSEQSPVQAIEQALFGDPRSIWGGEVIVNFPVDERSAELLLSSVRRQESIGQAPWMLDLVMAPAFTPEAVLVLGKRKERKLFENEALAAPFVRKTGFSYRFVRGGFLRQPPPGYILDLKECSLIGDSRSKLDELSMILAWATAFTSNHGGNEIALAKDGVLLGVGGGPSTVEAARTAVARAQGNGHDVHGAVFAADAFFPFTDAPGVLIEAGVKAGCIPGGGKHEEEVRGLFQKQGITMAYLPPQYRGFCRH